MAFLFLSMFSFAGCGGSNSSDSGDGGSTVSAGATATTTTALYITQLSPTPGTYNAVPPVFQVAFSEPVTSLSLSTVQNTSNWNVVCGGLTFNPNSVTITSAGLVNITMSSSVELIPSGTTCTFNASSNIVDLSGNPLSGTLSDSYTVQTGSASPALPYGSGGTMSYTSATYVSPYDYNYYYSTPIEETAQSGFSLVGFNTRSGSYVDQLQPVWGPNYGTSISGQITGGTYGGSGGSSGSLMCPIDSYGNITHVVGLYGTTDGFEVTSLGLVCQAQDGSSINTSYTSTVGGSSGYSFNLTCPSGTFASELLGYYGSYVTQLELGCE